MTTQEIIEVIKYNLYEYGYRERIRDHSSSV